MHCYLFRLFSLHAFLYACLIMSSTAYALQEQRTCPMTQKNWVLHRAQVQHGAKIYLNYCTGCHALRYVDPCQMSVDLNLHELEERKITRVSLPEQDAVRWFGKPLPDLSLIAHVRGHRWLTRYFNDFYNDPHRPFGVNNRLFPNVAMPNVLAPLQGVALQLTVYDLVAFLDYVAEPKRSIRYYIGFFVILFLIVCSIVAYLYFREIKKSHKVK